MSDGVNIRRVIVDTPGLTDAGESLQLHNNGPNDADLTGWRIGDQVVHPHLPYVYEFPKGFVIIAGGDVTLHSGEGVDDAQNLFWNHADPIWTNSGDRAILVNKAEDLIDSIAWGQRPPTGRVVRTVEIKEEIVARAAAVGGFGQPKGEVEFVVRDDGTELFWLEFTSGGAIFHTGFVSDSQPQPQLRDVAPQIYPKYVALNGLKTLGPPSSPTMPAIPSQPGVNALKCEFTDSAIYWSESTGAHAVSGPILAKWRSPEVGGPEAGFGLPIADERVDGTGGQQVKFSEFVGGSIWSRPEGTRALSEIRVEYVGLHCFGETEVDGLSESDEIYFVVNVQPLDRVTDRPQQADDSEWVSVLPSDGPAYENVDSKETHPSREVIFKGRPAPFRIKAMTFEQDEGDANALRSKIKTAVGAAGAVVSAVAPAAAAIASNPEVQAAVVDVINAIADTDDDFLGRGTVDISTRLELLRMLDAGLLTEPGVNLQFHTSIFMTDDDASYRAYFEIIPVIH